MITPTASRVQLARADALGKALAHHDWVARREPQDKHPGAVAATVHTRHNVQILVLSLGGCHGQMVEITWRTAVGRRGKALRRERGIKPSWRMTIYDAPIKAAFAAATAALDAVTDLSPVDLLGWTVERAGTCETIGGAGLYFTAAETPRGGKVRATRFIRPDEAVSASFYLPTYTPPCEHCTHYQELGGAGGWLITGPGFTAEATAHCPAAVISAFMRALPGHDQAQPVATPDEPTAERDLPAKTILPTVAIPGTRPVTAVC